MMWKDLRVIGKSHTLGYPDGHGMKGRLNPKQNKTDFVADAGFYVSASIFGIVVLISVNFTAESLSFLDETW